MSIMRFTKDWKLLSLVHVGDLPQSLAEWCHFIWGFDVWFGPIPALKSMNENCSDLPCSR